MELFSDPVDLWTELRFLMTLGEEEETETLLGDCWREKSHAIECFSQFEH